jgi:hypothetical chaperone protein
MLVCGLDFGTSNTAVALPSGAVLRLDATAPAPRLFRSVLFFPEDSKETLAEHAAIERYQKDNAGRFIQSMKTWLPATTFTISADPRLDNADRICGGAAAVNALILTAT